jgi:phage replication-related protein YjqB (UPF0714/DUF867 family)
MRWILHSRRAYDSFEELARHERENLDWRRILVRRRSPVALLAPHGGAIEPATSEIAIAIAGEELSLYCFEGCRRRDNGILHVSSTRFDDPACLDLLEITPIVVTVHGCRDRRAIVYVGGLHAELGVQAVKALSGSGFRAVHDTTDHNGENPRNLCNRGSLGRGLQLEVSHGLRSELFAGLRTGQRHRPTVELHAFAAAVRSALPTASSDGRPVG